MSRSITIAMFAVVAMSCRPARANTCEAAETAGGLVIPNLTGNMGCNEEPMKGLCVEFLSCLRGNLVCLVGDGKVYGGNSTRDFSGVKTTVTFGTRRMTGRTGEEVCFFAALAQAEGEDGPSWSSTVVELNGSRSLWEYQMKDWLRSPADFFIRSDEAAANTQLPTGGKK